MNDIKDRTSFVDSTKFQGSMDGVTYTDLFTIDDYLHDGWNYYDWFDTTSPKFNFYRFYGSKAGGCLINEIKVSGSESIDSSADSY
jgi:hypothetical protein